MNKYSVLNNEFNPSIKKIHIAKEKLIPKNYGSFWELISKEYELKISFSVLKKFSFLLNYDTFKGLTLIVYNNRIIDIQFDDTTNKLYGAAVDIGTTSVVIYLCDLVSNKLIGTYSSLNSQNPYGTDAFSRLQHTINTSNGLNELQEEIISTINKLLIQANNDLNDISSNLYNIVLCGNSIMQHLFLGLSPKENSPFVNITNDFVILYANELNLHTNSNCVITFLPLLGGFAGSDTTSVLLSITEDYKNRLIVDLGTSSEIAIGNIDSYFVASAACRPVFEGTCIEFGMRGTAGAIKKVSISENNVHLKVVEDIKPKGICGSGLIDIIAELLKMNIIDKTGSMLNRIEYVSKFPKRSIGERIESINGDKAFIIAYKNETFYNKDIYITQKDIRKIQLGKGFIYTGCIILLKKYGIKVKDLDEILISGAFCNYIDIDKAKYIGLIPDIPNVPVKSIGNGAGKGVQMYLSNRNLTEKCERIVNNTTHIELTSDYDFQNEYILNINF